MKILMLVISDVAHDSRVLREAEVLAGRGHAVYIVGRDVPEGWKPPAGIEVESASGGRGLKPAGRGPMPNASALRGAARWALLPRHRQRVWRTWARAAQETVGNRRFDVVHAHDFNVLATAAQMAQQQGAMLVYDSHEWWTGRQVHGRPAPFERRRERHAESQFVHRADAVLTVSGGIAQRLNRWRAPGASRVAVVRNTFSPRAGFTADLPKRPVSVVYAGRIGPARDLETLLEATAAVGLGTHLLGPADRTYFSELRVSTGAVRIDPALPIDEVDEVLRRGGISVVPLADSCENHRLALPNKLFHAVRAGVPVVAADLPEMRRMVTEYGLGTLYRPGDPGSMRVALQRLIEEYPRWCEQVAAAADELSWDQDGAKLAKVYDELSQRHAAHVTAQTTATRAAGMAGTTSKAGAAGTPGTAGKAAGTAGMTGVAGVAGVAGVTGSSLPS